MVKASLFLGYAQLWVLAYKSNGVRTAKCCDSWAHPNEGCTLVTCMLNDSMLKAQGWMSALDGASPREFPLIHTPIRKSLGPRLGRKSQQPGLGRARKGCARNENAIEIHAAWGKPLGKTNKQQDFGSHMQPKLAEAWGAWKPL